FHGMAGIDALEVPYKSLGDALADVIAGRVDYYFAPLFSVLGNKEKMRVLAVTTRVRSQMLPEVPTMAEAALPAYDMPAWRSIMGPAGMKTEVVEILSTALARGLAA